MRAVCIGYRAPSEDNSTRNLADIDAWLARGGNTCYMRAICAARNQNISDMAPQGFRNVNRAVSRPGPPEEFHHKFGSPLCGFRAKRRYTPSSPMEDDVMKQRSSTLSPGYWYVFRPWGPARNPVPCFT